MSSNKKEVKQPATIQNKRAYYDYEILDTYEAGIVLVGSEVKSIFKGSVHLGDAFCRILNKECWIMNIDVEQYRFSKTFIPERRRDRKLLLHKKEILQIDRKLKEKGLTAIPLKMYFKDNKKVKVLIGLAKGKKEYDKRRQIAERDTRREREREIY